ncbi:hypothetical protein PPL_05921 [Heterostelium album PN500]|uniref:Uncharacterized protein n=1 Tax=Heterostelium pallidum (strain ATCC 26659 / Pp 5 / PN500) TaxID=670386 RepID=D3BBQ2_HETP5|nr:hypothetical protein PPL_05921 [Heterostelium album PN500]EFA81085.1 hypothetical protein PPL_05921 [Heterostelium album PN500]|eukprot:XP_020433203.1 hypothetical protein PPL_05921 [Heterostelium album PN500]
MCVYQMYRKKESIEELLSTSEITSDSGELKARISVILALCGWDYYNNNKTTVEDRKKVVFESLLSRSISSWSGSSSFISFKNIINPQSTTNTNTTPLLSTSTSTSNIQPVSSSSTIVDAQSSNNNNSNQNEHRWFCPWVNDSKDEINDNINDNNSSSGVGSGNTNNSSSSTSNTPTATTSATSTTSNNYQTSSQHTTTTSIKSSASGWENLLSIVVHNQFIPKSSFSAKLNRKLILPTTTTNKVITNNNSNHVNSNTLTI